MEIKNNGFTPLQQLQRRARQQMAKQKQQSVANSNLVIQPKIYNKYQVSKDTIFYIKFGVYFSQEQQQRLLITDYDKSNSGIQNHWMKFRMWTYEESHRIKDSCCQLDQYRNYVYNKSKLFKTKIKILLLDWSFKQINPDMKLMHVNGILSDQSIADFMSLHPNILFHVQSKLNSVLQANS